MTYKCPKHKVNLRTVEDYPGALVCQVGARWCPDIFTVIDDHLCVLDGTRWKDIKTGEYRLPAPVKEG